MGKSREDLFNYVLTVAFVLLILVFLVSVVQISRYVFSDVVPLKEHVAITQNLLEDIGEVEASVAVDELGSSDLSEEVSGKGNLSLIDFVSFEDDLSDVAYVNMNKNKGVLSLVFTSSISQRDGIYYLNVDSLSDIVKGDKVVYVLDGFDFLKVGRVFIVHDDYLEVFDLLDEEVVPIAFEEVLGKVILRFEDK